MMVMMMVVDDENGCYIKHTLTPSNVIPHKLQQAMKIFK
jgi:hypothetical protein